LCAEVLSNSGLLLNQHFTLFIKLNEAGEVYVCGTKSFATFNEYRNYIMQIIGNGPFCGFPGKEKDLLTFGLNTKDITTSFRVDHQLLPKKITLLTYEDPKAANPPFNQEAFFKGIEKQLRELRENEPPKKPKLQ
jgi:hypothetical protein